MDKDTRHIDGLIEKLERVQHLSPERVHYMTMKDAISIVRQHFMGEAAPCGVLSREEDKQKTYPSPAKCTYCKMGAPELCRCDVSSDTSGVKE